VTSPHKEYSWLEEILYIDGFDHVHCRDHELFLLAQGLAAKMVVEKIPCVLARKEVYVPYDWGTKYRIDVVTSLWDPFLADISRVIDIVAHIGWYMMIQWCVVGYRSIRQCTMVCSGFLGCFP